MVETRVKNSSRNMVFALLTYVVQIVLGFLVRRYFIFTFNAEYLGLNSLFTNVLSVLSLAELGFGAALVFAMYKPMADNDTEKVKQLLAFYKKSYQIIGCVVLLLGLCVLPFMNYFQSKAPNVDINIYIVYFIFLFNSVVSYFFSYRRSLLYVSQRNDIESKVGMLSNLLSVILQFVVLLIFKNYYLYIGVSIVATLFSNLTIYYVTEKKYSDYIGKPSSPLDRESRKTINTNIFSLIFHKIGSVVVYSTDSLIIFCFLNSATLGKYSNYLLIITYVTTILTLFTGSLRGSIGNSIACETKEKNYKLLNKLNFMYFWIVSFCAISIFVLSDSFIDVVLTKGEKVLTLDISVILLLSISFYLNNTRYMTGMFKECAGIFYPDRFKSIFESIINLVMSIILVNLIGLPGVIIGTIISTLTTSLWIEPYVLNKHYLKKSTIKYFGKYVVYTMAMLIAGAVTYFACSFVQSNTIWTLILKFAICAIVPNVALLVCLCWMPEFKECVRWGIDILSSVVKKQKGEKSELCTCDDSPVLTSNIDVDGDGIVDISVSVPTHDDNPFDDKIIINDEN